MSACVSVVIPTRDRPAMLPEAIATVRAQTLQPLEIIIVSNGEAEHSRALNRATACRYDCRYFELKEGNRSAARNFAIEQAKGEWIALLDDDDLWVPDKLERQLRFALETGAECVFTDFIIHHVRNGTRLHYVVGRGPHARLSVIESFMIWRSAAGGCSTALVKRDLLLGSGGFDPNMELAEDWDLWRRLSQACEVAFLHEPLSTVRTHGINGEDHVARRPWHCMYWDTYQLIKAIRQCPPSLRHMVPKMLIAIAKRVVLAPPFFFLNWVTRGALYRLRRRRQASWILAIAA
jgi:glycosyltransferase involved in cell wall biosynthesis